MHTNVDARVARILVIFATCLGTGCTLSELDLSAKQCPCSVGFYCDISVNRCVVGTSDLTDARDDGGSKQQSDGSQDACLGDADGDGVADCLEPQEDAGTQDAGTRDAGTQSDAAPDMTPDAGPAPSCDTSAVDCLDPDGDGISDDGDLSGVKGDAPCTDGLRVGCDDNCPLTANPWQDDGDNDGVGDACDAEFCRSSSTLVAVGHADQVHVSKDQGQTWVKRMPAAEAGFPKANWEDVVHAHGTWLSINGNGNGSTWARSVDGSNWTVHSLPAWQGVTSAQAVGYADGRWYLASNDGRLAVSHDDGLSFGSVGAPQGWNGTAIESFAYHSGRLIAVGDQGQISYSDEPALASSWTTRQVGSGDYKQIVVVAGRWVAAGKSTCYYSDDRGEDWTSCGAPPGSYYGLHYANGLWMLGEQTSGAWVSRGSPDNWSEQVFLTSGGAWPVFGDCGSGRWFAGDKKDVADQGLRMSEDEGRDAQSARVVVGGPEHLYGITGN